MPLCNGCGQWFDRVATDKGIKLAITFTVDELIAVAFLVTDAIVRERCLTALALIDPHLARKTRKEILEAF